MNVVILVGRLTDNPELRHTNSNISVTRFSIAVDRRIAKSSEERQTDFINIVAWRQTAEFITTYFKKGQRIGIEGSLRMNKFTDKDGNKRSAVDIIAENVYFGDSKKDSETSDNASAPTTGYATAPSQNSDFANVGEEDGELPF